MALSSLTEEFSPLTRGWLESTDRERRKSLGQYMTPRAVREKLLDQVELRPGMRVLDPGAGTGEFLGSVRERQPECELFGWDLDGEVLAVARQAVPEAKFEVRDALDPREGEKFDLVLGNPPYFQFRASPVLKSRFSRVISGRPNIFALFFQAAIESLRKGGQLAFVVPPSMNNGAYFEGLRNFITDQCSIDHLELVDGADLFADAQTAVQIIVLTKGPAGSDFTFTRRCPQSGFSRTIFAENPGLYHRSFEGRRSLYEQGFEASTGTIVWNQVKDRLRSKPGPDTVPLIWARNLRNGTLLLDSGSHRKQFVVSSRRQCGPAIVVNRIVGAVGSGSMRCAFIPEGMEFVGENHTNVITARSSPASPSEWEHLLSRLSGEKTAERIRLLTGNTQLSATELTHLIPIDPF